MKKFKYLMLAMTAMLAFTLTSCEVWYDDDRPLAYDLEGTWKGDMYMIRDGNRAVYSEIEFVGNPYRSRSGTGRWYDEYSGRPGDYFYSRIDWEVRNGNIYIWLLDDNDFELVIRDYDLVGDRFVGYVDYAGGSRRFDLIRTYNPHWNSGYYDWGYGYDYDYYWAKGSRSADANDSTKVQVPLKPHTHEMRMD